jgi:hypothetical protein
LKTQQQTCSTGSKTRSTITTTTIITTAVMWTMLRLLHMMVDLMACQYQPGQCGCSAHALTGSSSWMLYTQQKHGEPCVSQ